MEITITMRRLLRRLLCALGFHSIPHVYVGDNNTEAWTCSRCGRDSPDLRRAKRATEKGKPH